MEIKMLNDEKIWIRTKDNEIYLVGEQDSNVDVGIKSEVIQMQRQAMCISVKDLRNKADELEKELLYIKPTLEKGVLTQKCQVNIVNNHNTSDEWRFE